MIFYSFGKRIKNFVKVKIIKINKPIGSEHDKTNLKDGIIKFYYSDGKIKAECNYCNNVLDGISKHYYHNGKVRAKENYKNGKLDGLSIYYFKNGKIEFEKYFRKGLLEYSNKFDIDGKLFVKK